MDARAEIAAEGTPAQSVAGAVVIKIDIATTSIIAGNEVEIAITIHVTDRSHFWCADIGLEKVVRLKYAGAIIHPHALASLTSHDVEAVIAVDVAINVAKRHAG